MKQDTYLTVSGFIFLAIVVLHGFRLYYGWEAVIGGFSVPLWASWIAVIVAGTFAYSAFQLAEK